MKNIRLLLLLITIIFSQGCSSLSTTPTPPPISEKTNGELIHLLKTFENSSNEVSEYPPYEIFDELEKRGASASEAAPMLAKVIAFDGSTSVTASSPLVAMGSSARPAIPYLLQNLASPREDVRRYSIFVLGTIGTPAQCAVPQLATFLWDPDRFVRSATAGALTEITQIELVEDEIYKLDPTMVGGVFADEPEGNISGIAREWWLNTGQGMNWPVENCELPK